ncbi:DUF2306 domain-containing protein [Cognatishimia sp. WU-CL00825]|uniref:DUF2306 domain-containing protein n=1 Tax=Cognatishimia sp. WU-CL00825 TaxID=3127658 RepID=UPI003105645A
MASFTPLLNATPVLQLHVASAILAICLAPIVIFRERRDRSHKQLGYFWVSAMMICAISSLWLHGIRLWGLFSPIHLLSLWTIFGLGYAVRQAIRGNIAAHRKTMKSIAFWGLGVAGSLTFMPGRMMNEIAFPNAPVQGFATILVFFILVVSGASLRQRRFS